MNKTFDITIPATGSLASLFHRVIGRGIFKGGSIGHKGGNTILKFSHEEIPLLFERLHKMNPKIASQVKAAYAEAFPGRAPRQRNPAVKAGMRSRGPSMRSGYAYAQRNGYKGTFKDYQIHNEKCTNSIRERCDLPPIKRYQKNPGNTPSQSEYHAREMRSMQAQLAANETAPLPDRKAATQEAFLVMRDNPALIADRIGWLFNGDYGYGAQHKAKQIIGSPRMNRVAALTQLLMALDHNTPMTGSIQAWKRLTPVQQKNLKDLIEMELAGSRYATNPAETIYDQLQLRQNLRQYGVNPAKRYSTNPRNMIAQMNRFEISMPKQAVLDLGSGGRKDEIIEDWLSSGKIKFHRTTPENIRQELQEYGAWDEVELADNEANRRRIAWMAASNLYDNLKSK